MKKNSEIISIEAYLCMCSGWVAGLVLPEHVCLSAVMSKDSSGGALPYLYLPKSARDAGMDKLTHQ